MASTVSPSRKVTQKRARRTKASKSAPRQAGFDEKRMKQLVKEAVREVLEERADLADEEAAWDRQIEADAEAGRLDRLADQAIADLNAGRVKDL